MNPFSAIFNGLKKLWSVISSKAAQRAIETATDLVKIALPIVQELSIYKPGLSAIADVLKAYEKYGIPIQQAYNESEESVGNALLNLATELLRKRLMGEQATLATNILHTAIQLAVTALKAK